MKSVLLLCLAAGLASAFVMRTGTTNQSSVLWPAPAKITLTQDADDKFVNPCSINYRVEAVPNDNIKRIINMYLIDVFNCKNIEPSNLTLSIAVKNPNQMVAEKTEQERYSLIIRTGNNWELTADYYVGFLRGFETFSQLLEQKENAGEYFIKGIPIVVDDEPEFVWRGVMIDTARHYLSVDTIKHTIDGLLFNKMSVLHWHITDEDSFPLEVPARPELSGSGKVGGTYSSEDVKEIIAYAKLRGVRVIPEIDTPAHT